MVYPAQANIENFLREGHARLNGFRLAAGAGPMLEALGAVVLQPLTVHPAETQNKQQFYMQICESPIEDRRRF
jgi:hypothetical protein